ncbi:MAG: hypothetical protein ACTMUP_09945 [cyanobacterium endosymbiont of Rhopalodia musculus]
MKLQIENQIVDNQRVENILLNIFNIISDIGLLEIAISSRLCNVLFTNIPVSITPTLRIVNRR